MKRAGITIETLAPGEAVVIHMHGRLVDHVNTWSGTVVAVDGVTVRARHERPLRVELESR